MENEDPEFNPRAQEAILKGVREQLESPESPYVRFHFDRLIDEGIPEEEVMKMLGAVLAVEMWEIHVQNRDFNEKEYIERLKSLPDMSWMDED